MSTTTTAVPTTTPVARSSAISTLRGVAADVALPMGTYYGLHALGLSDQTALLAATVAAGARVALVAVRSRRLSGFAALVLGVYAVGLVLSFVSGDPRFMLLKDSAGTAVVGLGFLVSLLGRVPMALTAIESARPEIGRLYRENPRARRTIRGITVLWGLGLLAEAALRVPLVYALPVSVAVGISHAMMLVVSLGLGAVTALWIRASRRRAPAQA
ncbi:VC0807 family protein [Actinomycetospora atypica]|uniref:VC0807 family protein n=1 Tax=Actinomycetospora atypica TaxID=1290095 RepID=A0ABV9YJR6_9PSEU